MGHMSSKITFGAKNTGQKSKDSCPGVILGAGRGGAVPSFSGVGRGRVENFLGRGGPGQPFPPGRGGGRGEGRGGEEGKILQNTHFFLKCGENT